MSEQYLVVRRLKVISVLQALLIAFMLGLILYLLQYIRQGSTVTITPTLTSSAQAATLPNASSTPTLDMQVPAAQNTMIQPKFQRT